MSAGPNPAMLVGTDVTVMSLVNYNSGGTSTATTSLLGVFRVANFDITVESADTTCGNNNYSGKRMTRFGVGSLSLEALDPLAGSTLAAAFAVASAGGIILNLTTASGGDIWQLLCIKKSLGGKVDSKSENTMKFDLDVVGVPYVGLGGGSLIAMVL